MAIFDPMPASVSGVFPAAAQYNVSQGLSNYETAGGYLSNARHATASALQRDALGGGIMGGIGANVLGGLNEVVGLIKGGVRMLPEKYGGSNKDDFGDTWRQTKEDLAANLYGSLYGKSTTAPNLEYNLGLSYPAVDVYSDMINKLSTSSGEGGIKEWLENIMEKEAEESTLPNTLTLNQLKYIMNKSKTPISRPDKPGGFTDPGKGSYGPHKGPTYTGPVTHSFDPKQDTGRRPDKPGGFTDPGKGSYGPHKGPTYTGPITYDFDPKQDTGRRPDKPGGFTDPGKGSYGPHKAYGGRVSYFDGGLASLWLR